MPGTDPFSLVYERVWDILTGHKPLADLVNLRNRIRFDQTEQDPEKQEIEDSDLPELMLVPAGGEAEPFDTNTTARATQDLELQLTTGDLRVHEVLFPVKWQLLRALVQCGVQLGGFDFVRGVGFSNITEEFDNDAANRGTRGWSATITIRVDMHFDVTKLVADRLINDT